MNKALTDKQKIVYDFLKSEIRKKGYPPSVREICKATGLSSTSTVHAHLETLEKKGYIHREATKNRSIEILEDDFYGFSKEIIHVPIVGKVSAGEPIFAVENIEDTFPLPVGYINGYDTMFMLRIAGDSMIEAGIFNRDLVLVRQQQTANNGDIVIALLDDSATCKTYYKEKKHIRLQPENAAYDPIITKNVVLLGKVTGLFRQF